MADREDIMAPRKKKDGGTYWVKIGTCWVNDGKRQLVFDALPIPDAEGRCVANLFEPRDNNQRAPQQARGGSGNVQNFRDEDDSIPFATSDGIW